MFKRHDDGTYSFTSRFWVQAIIMGLLICMIGWSTQRTANRTEQLSQEVIRLAEETQDCLNQLITVNKARSALNSQRDDLSEHQRLEILRMFQSLLSPPASIAALSPTDPVRQKWGEDVARVYVMSIASDQKKIDDLKAELTAHPIPDPNCGNKPLGQ